MHVIVILHTLNKAEVQWFQNLSHLIIKNDNLYIGIFRKSLHSTYL
jgi:hypothetical protein